MKKTLLAIVIASACGTASAQAVDYVALEQLFGETVTTSVTGSPQRASDAAASMEILDADAIRRSGARDIPTLLRHVAGVDVLQTTMSHGDVGVRGYNQAFSPRLLVLLDGRQVYADYYGFTPWDAIPVELDAIRQIEVVRGPNAALFGFNAVGGVINIITYDALEDITSSASATVGTQDVRQVSAVSGWRFGDRAGLHLSVGRRENSNFETPGATWNLDDEREAVNVEAGFRVTERVRAYVEGTYSDAPHTEIGPVYSAGFTEYETDSLKARVEADTRFALITASIYKNDIVATIVSTANLVLDNELEVAQVGALAKLGANHTVRVSLEDRHSEVPTTPVPGAKVFYDVVSVSGMWEWHVADSVVLTNAVRFDELNLGREGSSPPGYPWPNSAWDRDYDATSFNSGVVWSLGESDVLRFTVARGVQLPSLFNLGGAVFPIPPIGYFSGFPNLEPAVVNNYEVSWSRPLESLGARLRIGAFRGRTTEVIAGAGGSDIPNGIVAMPINIGNSHMHGLEIAIDGEHEAWRWGASYTPVEIDDQFTPGITVAATQTQYEGTTPRHVLNANLGWSRGPWEIDGFLRYQSSFDGILTPNPAFISGALSRIASYVVVDGRVGYRLNDRMLVSVAGQGLTREEQRQTAPGGLVERRLLATFRVTF